MKTGQSPPDPSEKKKGLKVSAVGVGQPGGNGLGKKKAKKAKKISVKDIVVPYKIRDVSAPGLKFSNDKFLLGDRYSLQVKPVTIKGNGGTFSTTVLNFAREIPSPNIENRKPYSFGLPMRLIHALKEALDAIIREGGLKEEKTVTAMV